MEREEIRLELLHLKEGGLDDLLLEYAEAVIEDHQEEWEGNTSLTRIPIYYKIENEVLDIIEQLLDKAREEGRREGERKLYRSISKELYKLYGDIDYLGDLRDEVYNLSSKYEKLSKLNKE